MRLAVRTDQWTMRHLGAPSPLHATGLAVALVLIGSAAHAGGDLVDVAKGAAIYGNYCASCHGEELRNTSGGVTFDLRRLHAEDHARFINVVLNGKSQMPPWRGVLELHQIEAIWAYIRASVDDLVGPQQQRGRDSEAARLIPARTEKPALANTIRRS